MSGSPLHEVMITAHNGNLQWCHGSDWSFDNVRRFGFACDITDLLLCWVKCSQLTMYSYLRQNNIAPCFLPEFPVHVPSLIHRRMLGTKSTACSVLPLNADHDAYDRSRMLD
jgi:hypothetical protein